ncbi:G-PROTEIN-RECEP-F1-2 domain-containing protein [Aphelenchoides fujianensis]|nr:G-PROTEIN-RECEP-F1-2 domain-containing protein [Aphelenchoides fujianensis]
MDFEEDSIDYPTPLHPTNSSDLSETENPPVEVRSCEQWHEMFTQLNHYFRDDDVLQGSEHSSVEVGYLIVAAYTLLIALGIFGNTLTILAILHNKQMRNVRNYFILNLAVADFFVCVVTAPTTLYTIYYVFWPFGTALCKVAGSLQGFNLFLSTFSITAIALDRYVLVLFPTKRRRQHNLSLLFFVSIWTISILLALPLFDASDLNVIFEDSTCGISLTICHEKNEIWQAMRISKEVYTVGVLVVQYACPLVSIAFAYSRIARRMGVRFAARNSLVPPSVEQQAISQRRKSIADRHRRTHFLMVALVAVFAIAWLPLNIFHLINTFGLVSRFHVPTFGFCHVAAISSACINPFALLCNHNFRTEFVAIFDKIGLIRLHDRLSELFHTSTNGVTKNGNLTNMATMARSTTIPQNYEAVSEAEIDLQPTDRVETSPRGDGSSFVVVTNTI